MPKDFFSVLNNLFTKEEKVDTNYDFKETFMLMRYISFYPPSFALANDVNLLSSKLPSWATMCLLYYGTKKENRWPKINYLKRKAEEKKNWNKELVNKVMSVFNCNDLHAIQILDIFNSIDKRIIEKFGVEVKK